ncbi:MAG: transcriptional regulator [Planctomycetota bacterium]
MHAVKRIEIVIDKPHVPKVRKALEPFALPGLSVLEVVAGYGDRGERHGGGLSDALANQYLLTTCRPEQLTALAEALEPVLRRYGGLCLISDAMVIRDEA